MGAGSSAFSTDDTIVAIATPAGRGAIGIVRLSGADALRIATSILDRPTPLEPRHATFTRVRPDRAASGDEVVATYFNAPRSYTGEDVVELSGHGSPVLMQLIVDATVRAGARRARPGEFTLRAFLNGKRDLVQAEAVGDLIAATTPMQARLAFDQLQGTLTAKLTAIDQSLLALIARLEASLDFPDEGYHFAEPTASVKELTGVIQVVEALLSDRRRGVMIREGAHVVITGRPNTGKSLIFNCLAGSDRAIVSDIPGTTRDLITETVDIHGIPVLLVDTAGIRSSEDLVETEGVNRAVQARDVADVVMLVLDRSEPLQDQDLQLLEHQALNRLVVVNKCDLTPAFLDLPNEMPFVLTSAKTGLGLDSVRAALAQLLSGGEALKDTVAMSNSRHISLTEAALDHLKSALEAIENRIPEEFVLTDLRAARERFDEVVGARTSDDILTHIFERFCIGK
ncbi:MAG: tRNA uridine-5-carboxymethylaminomethyl(34) synthesis GTPase MnmE [Vicinamibacterales bacterium]